MLVAPLARPTLVLGLGNPILGDDGVGWRVVDLLEARLGGAGPARARPAAVGAGGGDTPRRAPASSGDRAAPGHGALENLDPVELDRLSLGGLRLMERLVGYQRAILVDAVATGEVPAGTVRSLCLTDLPAAGRERLASPHDSSLATALLLGRELGAQLPEVPWVVAVEAGPGFEFGLQLSPAVDRAVPKAADEVLRLLRAPAGRTDRREGSIVERPG